MAALPSDVARAGEPRVRGSHPEVWRQKRAT